MKMPQHEIDFAENLNSGTSWTNNQDFEKDGYLVIRNLCDPNILFCEVPEERGQLNYYGSLQKFTHTPVEIQVEGSLARYSHPMYKETHTNVRIALEKIIGRKLYNTYFYDRFYFAGQELHKHVDRDACEISVSIHISTNLDECWPFKIKSVSGEENSLCLNPGDGLLYKGCERPHWRDPLPSKYNKFSQKLIKILRREDDTYYHQIFFHYVLADGIRSHFAGDLK